MHPVKNKAGGLLVKFQDRRKFCCKIFVHLISIASSADSVTIRIHLVWINMHRTVVFAIRNSSPAAGR